MRRIKTRVSPNVEAMEPRALLSVSTAGPLLSPRALNGVVRNVSTIMSTLARTENTAQANLHLTRLSARVPFGPEGLAPLWQSDLGLYRPHSARALTATKRQLLGDLYRFVQGGNVVGNRPVTGPAPGTTTSTNPGPSQGGTATPTPTPAPVPMTSLDSVRIENTTGLALRVTVYLRVLQVQQPWITETIPMGENSIALFNFGTATNAFMTLDVSRADGGQSPPPFNNVSLSRPMNGYNGTLFTISLFSSYFNVTPL